METRKFANLSNSETWEFEDFEVKKFGHLEIDKSGNLEIWKIENLKTWKFGNFETELISIITNFYIYESLISISSISIVSNSVNSFCSQNSSSSIWKPVITKFTNRRFNNSFISNVILTLYQIARNPSVLIAI